jgi:predicted DNA repair protein MutK
MVFVVDKATLCQVFLQVLCFSPVSITPLMLHTHLYLNIKETNKQAEAWESSKKAKHNVKEHGQKSKFFLA